MGFLTPWFLAGRGRRRAAGLAAPAAKAQEHAAAVQLADVLRAAHAELHQASPPAVPGAVRAARRADSADGAGVRAPLYRSSGSRRLQRSNEVTVLAIDNSLSMRAGNRLDEAKRQAKSLIGGLRARRARAGAGLRAARAGHERGHRRPCAARTPESTASKPPTRAPRTRSSRGPCDRSRNRSICRCTCTFFPTCSSPACRRISTICG